MSHFFLKLLATEFLFGIFPSHPVLSAAELKWVMRLLLKQQMLFTMHCCLETVLPKYFLYTDTYFYFFPPLQRMHEAFSMKKVVCLEIQSAI